MAVENVKNTEENGFFDTIEMKEIMEFLESENAKGFNAQNIDKVAEAWSKVERKKLYNN